MKNSIENWILIVPALFALSEINAQNVFDDYEKELIVRNEIKKKTQWVYGESANSGFKSLEALYNEDGLLIEEVSYRSNGNITIKRNYKYNANGDIIEYQNYNGKYDKITYKKFVKYDVKGNKIGEVGHDGVDRFENKYTYDSRGRLQEIKYYISNDLIERRMMEYNENQEIMVYRAGNTLMERIANSFDNNNNLIKEAIYSPSGNEKKKNIFEYDPDGNLIKETKYYSGNLTLQKTYVYKGGKLMEVYIKEPDLPQYLDREYSYDADGRLVLEKWIDKRSKKYSTKTYKYDNKGNASEITSFFVAYNIKESTRLSYIYY